MAHIASKYKPFTVDELAEIVPGIDGYFYPTFYTLTKEHEPSYAKVIGLTLGLKAHLMKCGLTTQEAAYAMGNESTILALAFSKLADDEDTGKFRSAEKQLIAIVARRIARGRTMNDDRR